MGKASSIMKRAAPGGFGVTGKRFGNRGKEDPPALRFGRRCYSTICPYVPSSAISHTPRQNSKDVHDDRTTEFAQAGELLRETPSAHILQGDGIQHPGWRFAKRGGDSPCGGPAKPLVTIAPKFLRGSSGVFLPYQRSLRRHDGS